MSLLTPLFLLGLIGIGLPIWLHRLQTQTTDREKFSSTMFLEPSKHRIHVQRKLKYLLLLALRILFLAILVFAFARPILNLPAVSALTEADTHHVIVLDTSFSMHRGDNFEQALDLARGIIADMEDGDQASIYSASSRVTTVSGRSTDRAALSQALAPLEPDYGRLDLGAMVSALNGLIVESPGNVELHLVSDFQQSGQPIRFADLVPDMINGRPVTLTLERVTSDNNPNWYVESVIVGIDEVSVTVRGSNTGAAEKTVSLSVNDSPVAELTREVPANGQTLFLFQDVAFEGGDNKVDARITPADDLAVDDHRFTVLDNSPPAPVLLITRSPGSLAVVYITSALETAPRPYQAQIESINDLDTRILQRFPWVIIEDLGVVNPTLASAITEYINAGGAVLATLGESALGLASLPISEHSLSGESNLAGNQRRTITRIDNSHPALNQSASWANVNITRVMPLQATNADNVLVSLDNNTPFLLERDIGQGRFMLFNASLDNTWTDLPLKPVFVSFMAEAARYLSNENILQRERISDSFMQLSSSGGASGQVFDPDGVGLLSLEATTRAQEVQLREIGYYQVITPAGEVLIAVNPDLRESDLTVMEPQLLQNWQNAVSNTAGANNAGQAVNAAAAQEEDAGVEIEIWRVFLVLLVIIVLAESLLGNRYLRFNTGTS
ncbi:MAG: BatA and WFA domain-containing protein [Pseudohongiellaceae bacterium]